MIINFISEIQNYGIFYIKKNDLEISIGCYQNHIRVVDFKKNKGYEIVDILPIVFLRNLKKNELKDFLEYIEVNSNEKEINIKRIFSPFYKIEKGEIIIKNFNLATLKKIMKHEDTKIIMESKYTDDYYLDYITNYSKNKVVDKNEVLKDLIIYSKKGVHASKEGNNISLSTIYGKYNYIVNNKNLKFEFIK